MFEKTLNEKGISLIEILFGLLLVSVVAMGIVQSSTIALKSRTKSIKDTAAMQLALQSLENFSAIDPENLSDSDDLTEVLESRGIEYTRVVDITENDDKSKTVFVSVSSKGMTKPVSTSVTLIEWGAK